MHLGHAWSTSPTEYFRGHGFRRGPRIAGDFLPLIGATWRGIDSGTEPPFSARISVHSVPSHRKAEIASLVEAEALPATLAWLHAIETGPQTTRTDRHRWTAYLVDDALQTLAE